MMGNWTDGRNPLAGAAANGLSRRTFAITACPRDPGAVSCTRMIKKWIRSPCNEPKPAPASRRPGRRLLISAASTA